MKTHTMVVTPYTQRYQNGNTGLTPFYHHTWRVRHWIFVVVSWPGKQFLSACIVFHELKITCTYLHGRCQARIICVLCSETIYRHHNPPSHTWSSIFQTKNYRVVKRDPVPPLKFLDIIEWFSATKNWSTKFYTFKISTKYINLSAIPTEKKSTNRRLQSKPCVELSHCILANHRLFQNNMAQLGITSTKKLKQVRSWWLRTVKKTNLFPWDCWLFVRGEKAGILSGW